MQLDPVLNSLLCSSDLIVTNVCFVFVDGVDAHVHVKIKVLHHIAQRMVSAETLNLIISGLQLIQYGNSHYKV